MAPRCGGRLSHSPPLPSFATHLSSHDFLTLFLSQGIPGPQGPIGTPGEKVSDFSHVMGEASLKGPSEGLPAGE